MYAFFDCCDGLIYVFLSDGGSNDEGIDGCGPDFLSAVGLFIGVCHNMRFEVQETKARQHTHDTVEQVQARVGELKNRPGVSFILFWHVEGEAEGHVGYSENYSWSDVREQIISFLQEELQLQVF